MEKICRPSLLLSSFNPIYNFGNQLTTFAAVARRSILSAFNDGFTDAGTCIGGATTSAISSITALVAAFSVPAPARIAAVAVFAVFVSLAVPVRV